jgi:hypothetical protein
MNSADPTATPLERTSVLAQLWIVLLGPAAVWLAQFQTNYTLVPWVCVHGHAWLLHAVSVGAALLAVLLAWLAWTNWRRAGVMWPEGQADQATRTRFLAVLGLLSSGFFLLLIIGQGLATAFIDPCRS